MPDHNGIGDMLRQAALPQQPPMTIATPFNDVQTVAFLASNLAGTVEERVSMAIDLFVEACVQFQPERIKAAMQFRMKAAALNKE